MKKLNSYYLLSIVTLVLMAFIFIWRQQVLKQQTIIASPAEQLLRRYQGAFSGMRDSLALSIDLADMDSLEESRWLRISLDSQPVLAIRVSDFEDEQILVEPFLLDSLGRLSRLEGCELLLTAGANSSFEGGTLGTLCAYESIAQNFYQVKILLANTHARVDIASWDAEQDSLVKQTVYRLEKEGPT